MSLIHFIQLNKSYLTSIPRSIYYNIKLLGYRKGIRCPIFFSNFTRIFINKSNIIFKCKISTGMIKIGFTTCDFIPQEIDQSTFSIDHGTWEINGAATFGAGCRISIANGGIFSVGQNVWCTGRCTFIVRSGLSSMIMSFLPGTVL